MSIWRILLLIVSSYVLILFAALRWHLSYGPPISRATVALFVVFAMSAALLGLFSLVGVLGALHFSIGAALVIVASAMLLKLWMEFVAWSPHAVWEMIQVLAAQFLCLLIGFAVVRISGFQILQTAEDMGGPRGTRFSTRDLLVLMASVAVLFAVLGSTTPVISGRLKWLAIYATGGAAAALVVAAASWLCFGTKWTALRAAVCLFVAPIGGLIYGIASQYSRLLYNWQWFAGITITQMILMIIPLAVMRMQGFRFVRCVGSAEDPG